MRLEKQALLDDIRSAGLNVRKFTTGKTYGDYLADEMWRVATERQFEIIGEVLNLLSRRNPELALRISGYRRIISFRNILIHGYAQVDDRLVWSVVEEKLDQLSAEVGVLLSQSD